MRSGSLAPCFSRNTTWVAWCPLAWAKATRSSERHSSIRNGSFKEADPLAPIRRRLRRRRAEAKDRTEQCRISFSRLLLPPEYCRLGHASPSRPGCRQGYARSKQPWCSKQSWSRSPWLYSNRAPYRIITSISAAKSDPIKLKETNPINPGLHDRSDFRIAGDAMRNLQTGSVYCGSPAQALSPVRFRAARQQNNAARGLRPLDSRSPATGAARHAGAGRPERRSALSPPRQAHWLPHPAPLAHT